MASFTGHLLGNKMQSFGSDQSQRALTAPEELNGGVTSAITVFNITGIIPQVLLLYGANSQGNCHFLLAEMLLDDPARPTKQDWKLTEASAVCFSFTVRKQCVWMRRCVWMETQEEAMNCPLEGGFAAVGGWTEGRTLHAVLIFFTLHRRN